MSRHPRLAPGVLAVLLLSCGAPPLSAKSVSLRIDAHEAALGAEVEVPIAIAGNPGVGAMHIELTYDKSVLEAQGVDAGPLLEGSMQVSNTDEPGRVVLSVSNAGVVQGDGVLARVRFRVRGEAGSQSAVTLEKCRLWDDRDMDLLVELTPGSVKVVRAIPWSWVGGAAIALVLLGLIGAVMRRRRAEPASAAPKLAPAPARPPAAAKTPPPQPAAALKAPRCAKCGAELKATSRFCPGCGQTVARPSNCAKCGAALDPNTRFCDQCGTARA